MSSSYNLLVKRQSFLVAIKYVFVLFLIFNLLSSFGFYLDGYLGGDLAGIDYAVDLSLLVAFTILSIVSLLFCFLLSKTIAKINCTFYFNMSHYFYILFLVLAFLLLYLTMIADVGSIRRGVSGERWAEVLFAFLNPYILILLFLITAFVDERPSIIKKIIFCFVFFSYIVSIVWSGFTGYFIYLLPVFIYWLYRIVRSSIVVWFVLFLVTALFPYVRMFKAYLIADFNMLFDPLSLQVYSDFYKIVINRFSYVPNSIYIFDLADYSDFFQFKYSPFFQGYFGSFLYKLLGGNVSLITLKLHQVIQSTSSDSNSTFPMLSYFDIDIIYGFFVFIYSMFLIFIAAILLSFVIGGKTTKYAVVYFLIFCFSYFGVIQGWYWNAASFIQALILFSAFIFIDRILFVKMKNEYIINRRKL